METFTIGQVAKRAAVGIDTVRYYERHHLLPEAPRRSSGYREYDRNDVRRLRFIRRAKDLGFTLAEIGELLALLTDRESGVRGVKARAQSRLADVEQRIRELRKVQRGLQRLIDACPGHGVPERCPILLALGDESGEL
ncbi:MAG: heavy metal-responsive transcriptional regulator [Proteobacteria bacterium]|jgi:MerR family copper efflux transcriptional regulator|nr:heavy metal-responsive transcriptional regulator [Pseudomonadota bacterium]